MREIGRLIDEAITARGDDAGLARVRAEVRELCGRYPLYEELARV
jgi:glycine/serine hydroxymethyltransferase